ncbi:MAG: hypothetical protein IPM66_00815 [Acidobacteriota bacterium]|nr:MAG: hypothetical protein IPM66_00815 [Acidobacteriota bacterium]
MAEKVTPPSKSWFVKTFEFLKNPENMTFVITVVLSTLFAALGIIGLAQISWLISAILAVLSLLVALLWTSHRTANHIDETISELRKEIKEPAISNFIHRFDEFKNDIQNSLKTADEIWLLSRTGQGWWHNFGHEIKRPLSGNGKNRFLFLKPNSEAFKMAAHSTEPEWANFEDFYYQREKATRFFTMLSKDFAEKLELKVMTLIPACTLLIINPTRKNLDTVIYVELLTFSPGTWDRPVFRIKQHDAHVFYHYLSEFEEIWQRSESWYQPD